MTAVTYRLDDSDWPLITAKDRLIELTRQSEDISEMHEQLIRSQGFFMENSLNQIEIIYIP